MQVHRDIENLPAFPRAVVTIGTFDGVHLGHRQILRQMKEVAGAQGGQTVIITFDPHPREVLRPSPNQPGILNTLDEKISLLAEQGMDHLVVVPFTTAFSQLSPEAFIRDFLVRRFHPRTMIIGYDHHFGHDRKGDIGLLCRYGTILGFEVLEIPPRVVHEVTVSSTRIRQDIRDGNLEEASELLGYPYFFSGTVVAGARVGRTLGFPTANLEPGDPGKMLPGEGIYLSLSDLPSSRGLKGLLSIGMRPTFGGERLVTEVYLMHWEGEIYGQQMKVTVLERIRDQVRFEDAAQLKSQIKADLLEAEHRFSLR